MRGPEFQAKMQLLQVQVLEEQLAKLKEETRKAKIDADSAQMMKDHVEVALMQQRSASKAEA